MQHSENIEGHEADVEEFLQKAKKLEYVFRVLEEKRKEREENGDDINVEDNQTQSVEASEADLEGIDPPLDLHKLKDPDFYHSLVARAEQKIEDEKEKKLNGTRDDYATAMDKYVRAKEVYRAKIQQIQEIEITSSNMKEDMKVRKDRWRQFRDFISDYSGTKFDETREYIFR